MFLKVALNIKLFTGLHYKKSISGENAVLELCSVIAIKEVIKKPPVRTLTLPKCSLFGNTLLRS